MMADSPARGPTKWLPGRWRGQFLMTGRRGGWKVDLTGSGVAPLESAPAREQERPGGALRAVLLPAAVIAIAYFCYTLPFLGSLPLTGGMEANVVIAAREAVRDGHWLPGTQNGAP